MVDAARSRTVHSCIVSLSVLGPGAAMAHEHGRSPRSPVTTVDSRVSTLVTPTQHTARVGLAVALSAHGPGVGVWLSIWALPLGTGVDLARRSAHPSGIAASLTARPRLYPGVPVPLPVPVPSRARATDTVHCARAAPQPPLAHGHPLRHGSDLAGLLRSTGLPDIYRHLPVSPTAGPARSVYRSPPQDR